MAGVTQPSSSRNSRPKPVSSLRKPSGGSASQASTLPVQSSASALGSLPLASSEGLSWVGALGASAGSASSARQGARQMRLTYCLYIV